MARVLLFGPVRQAAGAAATEVAATTVGDALDALSEHHGARFAELLGTCRFWVNGRPATPRDPLGDHDELSILPPVSGG